MAVAERTWVVVAIEKVGLTEVGKGSVPAVRGLEALEMGLWVPVSLLVVAERVLVGRPVDTVKVETHMEQWLKVEIHLMVVGVDLVAQTDRHTVSQRAVVVAVATVAMQTDSRASLVVMPPVKATWKAHGLLLALEKQEISAKLVRVSTFSFTYFSSGNEIHCKKTGCWFVGGDDLTGALNNL